jgi:hypothetical protein
MNLETAQELCEVRGTLFDHSHTSLFTPGSSLLFGVNHIHFIHADKCYAKLYFTC